MDASAENEKAIERGVPRGCVVTGVGCLVVTVLLCVLAIGFSIYAFRRYNSVGANRVAEEMDRVTLAAEPLTAEALDARYQIPAGELDATDLWLVPLKQLDAPEFREDTKGLPLIGVPEQQPPALGEPWSEEEALRAFQTKYAPLREALYAAAASGGRARYPSNFGVPADQQLALQVRMAGRLLMLDAILAARAGNASAAVRALTANLALAQSLEGYPDLTACLVRWLLIRNTCARIAGLVPRLKLETDALQALKLKLEQIELSEGLRVAMMRERINGLLIFDNPSLLTSEINTESDSQVWSVLGNAHDRASYLALMREVLQAMQLPFPQRLTATREIETARRRSLKEQRLSRLQQVYTTILAPTAYALNVHLAETMTKRDAARCILAIEQFQQNAAGLPQTLDELVPKYLTAVPLDPFDGLPLRYRQYPNRYVIYSLGENQRDDGGESDVPPDRDVFLVAPRPRP